MELWSDVGIILRVRPYGEGACVVVALTQQHGKHAGYVHGGGASRGGAGVLDVGNLVRLDWKARLHAQLGSYDIEMEIPFAATVLQSKGRLIALQSACALCETCLPEREVNEGQFEGLRVLLSLLEGDHWMQAYVMWEIAFLRDMGYPLQLTQCAVSGSSEDLLYVSPKTGRAVSATEGEAYKDRLLAMPQFLQGHAGGDDVDNAQDIVRGLTMTGHFLQHWIFGQTTQTMPQARINLLNCVERLADVDDSGL